VVARVGQNDVGSRRRQQKSGGVREFACGGEKKCGCVIAVPVLCQVVVVVAVPVLCQCCCLSASFVYPAIGLLLFGISLRRARSSRIA
jgi:hypothetical protein